MKSDELLDLVNEKDEVIGTVWKSEAHKDPNKIHREVAIVVLNDRNQFLLQKRSLNKEHHPGRWSLTARHIHAGEKPLKAAKRELYEELGITTKVHYIKKMRAWDNNESRFFWIFLLNVRGNEKITFNKTEIDEIKWIKYEDLVSFSEKKQLCS